jgi:predicted TIM-barrel fold metal-dependent hydrolase
MGWDFLPTTPRQQPRVLDELERWSERAGMIKVKLHPHRHDTDNRATNPLLARARKYFFGCRC